MTQRAYTPHPFLGIPVAILFPMLQQREKLSRYAARAALTDLLEGRLGPVVITPPLPRGWRLIFSGNGIAIETADGILDAAQVFVKYATDDPPQIFAHPPQPAQSAPAASPDVLKPAAAKEQPAEQHTPPQTTPAAPPAVLKPQAAAEDPEPQPTTAASSAPPAADDKDQRAIALAAARLKPDDSVKRDDLWKALKPLPGISARYFEHHIWPAARKLAGLTERGKPGPKKKK
jgi:hypothetical protein